MSRRWVGSGRTVFNNKANPVKQYEPFFSSTHLYEPETELTETGVSPVVFYDSVSRVVATLHPNHTYEKVTFDPWQQTTYDVNDTVAAARRADRRSAHRPGHRRIREGVLRNGATRLADVVHRAHRRTTRDGGGRRCDQGRRPRRHTQRSRTSTRSVVAS